MATRFVIPEHAGGDQALDGFFVRQADVSRLFADLPFEQIRILTVFDDQTTVLESSFDLAQKFFLFDRLK